MRGLTAWQNKLAACAALAARAALNSSPPPAPNNPAGIMTTDSTPSRSPAAWLVTLLILTALAVQAGRIVSVRSPTGETPFHSANDRSRWCTVAALGGFGTYEIDGFLEIRDPSTKRRTWYTIDLVRHRGRDGKQHYYSSKPPLLSTLHAGVYAAVRGVTGLSLLTQTFAAARVVLVLVNLLPLALLWFVWGRYWRRQGLDDWALVMLTLFMLWGTYISTFANTLNNHLPGAVCAGLSLWAVLKIVEQGQQQWRWFALAGVTAAMTAACELPALSWLGVVGLLLLRNSFRLTLLGFVPAMLPVAAGFALTNIAAHGDLRPPYAHRAVGPLIATLDAPHDLGTARVAAALAPHGFEVSDAATVRETRTPGVLELWDEATQFRFALVPQDNQLLIHHWDDWYDYPNSYWYPERKRGIDRGEPSVVAYILQTLVGHHGVFSLTPLWLLAPLGAWSLFRRRAGNAGWQDPRVQVMLAIVVTTLVCYAFYMARPLEDRNYGGVSSGFRWMFWFTPLWLWLVSHALPTLQTPTQRRLAVAALCISIFSASFPWANPWSHPWIFQALESLGWIAY
jgi:hypothetical protein